MTAAWKGGRAGFAGQGVLPGPPGTLFQTPGSRDLGKELPSCHPAGVGPSRPQPQPAGSEARSDLSMTPGMEPGLVEALEAP